MNLQNRFNSVQLRQTQIHQYNGRMMRMAERNRILPIFRFSNDLQVWNIIKQSAQPCAHLHDSSSQATPKWCPINVISTESISLILEINANCCGSSLYKICYSLKLIEAGICIP